MSVHIRFDQTLLSEKIDRALITSEEPQRPLIVISPRTIIGTILYPLKFAASQMAKRSQLLSYKKIAKSEWCFHGSITTHADRRFFVDISKISPRFTTEFFQSEQGKLLRKIILTAQSYKFLPHVDEEEVYWFLEDEFQQGTCLGKALGILKISNEHKEPWQLLENLSADDILFHQGLWEIRSKILNYLQNTLEDAGDCLKDGAKVRKIKTERALDILRINISSSFDEEIEQADDKSKKCTLQDLKEAIDALFEERAKVLIQIYKLSTKDKGQSSFDAYLELVKGIDEEILQLLPEDIRDVQSLEHVEECELDILQALHEKKFVCPEIERFGNAYAAEIKKLQGDDIEKAGWRKQKKRYLNPLTTLKLGTLLKDDRYKSFIVGTPGHAWFINTENLYIYDQNLGGIAKYQDLSSLIADTNNYFDYERLNGKNGIGISIQPYERIQAK